MRLRFYTNQPTNPARDILWSGDRLKYIYQPNNQRTRPYPGDRSKDSTSSGTRPPPSLLSRLFLHPTLIYQPSNQLGQWAVDWCPSLIQSAMIGLCVADIVMIVAGICVFVFVYLRQRDRSQDIVATATPIWKSGILQKCGRGSIQPQVQASNITIFMQWFSTFWPFKLSWPIYWMSGKANPDALSV